MEKTVNFSLDKLVLLLNAGILAIGFSFCDKNEQRPINKEGCVYDGGFYEYYQEWCLDNKTLAYCRIDGIIYEQQCYGQTNCYQTSPKSAYCGAFPPNCEETDGPCCYDCDGGPWSLKDVD